MAHGTAGRNAVPQSGTVDPKEVARFNALAQSSWRKAGGTRTVTSGPCTC
jgi:hypothetical protein